MWSANANPYKIIIIYINIYSVPVEQMQNIVIWEYTCVLWVHPWTNATPASRTSKQRLVLGLDYHTKLCIVVTNVSLGKSLKPYKCTTSEERVGNNVFHWFIPFHNLYWWKYLNFLFNYHAIKQCTWTYNENYNPRYRPLFFVWIYQDAPDINCILVV